jgi:hypothetical protein
MRISSLCIDIVLKRSFALSLLVGGLAFAAYAQNDTPALPPLPPSAELPAIESQSASSGAALPEINLPSLPPVTGGNAKVDAGLPALPAARPASVPEVSGLPPLPAVKGAAPRTESAAAELPALPPISAQVPSLDQGPLPTIPEVTVESEASESEPEGQQFAVVPLPLPGEDVALPMNQADSNQEQGMEMPTIKVVQEEEPPKSWQTKLIPQVIPPKTKFNYKRQILPPRINRVEYSKINRHLPRRITRDDYAALLFTSVAKNDLDGTRALINAGTSLNATNSYGETPLQFARRIGASNVAALLVARGASR